MWRNRPNYHLPLTVGSPRIGTDKPSIVALDNPLYWAESDERLLFVKIFLNYHSKGVANCIICSECAKLGKRTGAFCYHKDNRGDPCNVLLEGDQVAVFRISVEGCGGLSEYDLGIQSCLKTPDAI